MRSLKKPVDSFLQENPPSQLQKFKLLPMTEYITQKICVILLPVPVGSFLTVL